MSRRTGDDWSGGSPRRRRGWWETWRRYELGDWLVVAGFIAVIVWLMMTCPGCHCDNLIAFQYYQAPRPACASQPAADGAEAAIEQATDQAVTAGILRGLIQTQERP